MSTFLIIFEGCKSEGYAVVTAVDMVTALTLFINRWGKKVKTVREIDTELYIIDLGN